MALSQGVPRPQKRDCRRLLWLLRCKAVSVSGTGYSAHTPIPSARQARTWWYKRFFYLQSSGHVVHSQFADVRLCMPGT